MQGDRIGRTSGNTPTLMFQLPNNLKRTVASMIALLQLLTLPATFELHICCDHSYASDHTTKCKFGCSDCRFHRWSADDEKDSSEPHDSHSCPICQAAFAVTTVDVTAL